MRWAIAIVVVAACAGDSGTPVQPIAFDHSVHAGAQQIPCIDCHTGAETKAHASLPALSRCLACHMKPQGQQPNVREQRVRELAMRGGAFEFVQVTRNPNHVHFSHSAHVSIAKMPCRDCHGDVTRWKRPPDQPDRALTNMGACLACHRERGAPTECGTCHH